MKIGFLRLGLPIELNLQIASASTLGTEIRAGLLHDWLELGYEVALLGGVPNKDLAFIRNKTLDSTTSWMQKLKYQPSGKPECDVLFIEMGVSNTLYSYKVDGVDKSYVKRVAECIEAFEGPVIFYQHGVIPFPFPAAFSATKSENPLNLGNIFKPLQNGKMWENRRWKILHHFSNEELFKQTTNEYKPYLDRIKVQHIPLCYSDIDPYLTVKPNPDFDSIWIGSQWDSASESQGETRAEEIRNFYDTGIKALIIGKWSDKEAKNFKHAKFAGKVGKHGAAYDIWNNALTCIWTTSKTVRALGLVPTRPIMAIRGGAICLADATISGVENFIDKEYIVSSGDEAKQKIEGIKAMTAENRELLRTLQLRRFKKWKELEWEKILLQ